MGEATISQSCPPLSQISEDGVLLNSGPGLGPQSQPLYTDPDYDVLPSPGMWWSAAMLYSLWDALVAEFPDYVSRSSLGQDGLGNHIYAYAFNPRAKRIDDFDAVALRVPKIIVQGGVHGSERRVKKSLLMMARNLCRNWRRFGGPYEEIRFGASLVIIPLSNPSGENSGTRKNHNGVDINRNFNVDWASVPVVGQSSEFYKGLTAASEAETRILQGLPTLYPDACAVLDSHEHSENMVFWLGTPTQELIEPAVQTLDKLTGWLRREIAPNTSDAQLLAKINSTPAGSGTRYYEAAGIPALLCETPTDPFHPGYGGAGGERIRTIVGEVALIESLAMILRREQARRASLYL